MQNRIVLKLGLLVMIGYLMLFSCKRLSGLLHTENEPTIKIAFGSCSKTTVEQPLWEDILADEPDVWIWLGDNIYGDTEDMEELRQMYNTQKGKPAYQKIVDDMTVLGIWDDHDYGANDAGKEYPKKVESQKEFLDFLEVPDNDDRRRRLGTYDSYDLARGGTKVKIILLDTRYFRDPLLKEGKRNIPDPKGKILGGEQWTWLENELKNSKADVHIIASSIQVIPVEHRFEKWENFPTERTRLFQLMKDLDIQQPIFISGDRHSGEISKIDWQGKVMYDITSSSLTHTRSNKTGKVEPNQYRVGNMIYDDENYGLIEISTIKNKKVRATIKTEKRRILEEIVLIGL